MFSLPHLQHIGAQRGVRRGKIAQFNEGKMPSGDEQQPETSEEESLQRLKRIRRGNRGKTTRLINEAYEFMQQHPSPDELDPEIRNKLEIKAQSIQQKKEYISQLDNEIIQKCNLNEIDREVDETTDVSTRIDESLAKLKNYLNKYGNSVERTTTQSPTMVTRPPTGISMPPRQPNQVVIESPSSQRSTSNNRSQGVRLPKISLPRFHGDITKFQHFWQTFCCAVGESEDLSNVHKLNYLVNSLEGQAYKALEGLEICEENYEKAKTLLQERFGKKQSIISAHMHALLKLQSSENERTADLRAIYDTIMVHIRGLESLGVSSDNYGSLLIPVIISRMPEDIALQVTRQTSKDVWSIEEIMTTIQQEIEAREVSRKMVGKEKRRNASRQQQHTPSVSTTKSFVARPESSLKNKKAIQCYFYNKGHFSNECKEVTDVKQRKAILQAAKRCFRCLRLGHLSKDCNFNRKCFHCNGNHNSALCNKDEQEPKQEPKPDTSMAMSSVKEKTNVLLQTATTYAYGEDKTKKVTVNILFDGGSQKSFISEELKRKLDLKSERTEVLNLNTFGSEKYVKKTSDRVKVNLVVQDEVIVISALTSPAVCSPLCNRVEISNYPHLNGLALAESVDVSSKRIDILIGADHYYDIVIGEVIRGSAGPVAISSKLGWLLSGPVSFSNDNESRICSGNNVINNNLVLDILPSREEVVDESREIVESLDRFWKHESMGIANDEQPSKYSPIEIAFKENQRYEVGLPWKDNISDELETNYDLSKRRLLSLYNKLKADPKLLSQYNEVFEQQLSDGIIEKVSESDYEDSNAHFLCHFGVVRNERPKIDTPN